MPRPKKISRSPLILIGEGEVDGLFLELFKHHYSKELSEKRVTVDHASGGSTESILERLEKKYLKLGHANTPCLVLLDSDIELSAKAKKIAAKYSNITIVHSTPQCLEGLLLELLDDQLPTGQQRSPQLKKHFQQKHLGSETKVQVNFRNQRERLFPKELLEAKRSEVPALDTILKFLGL